MPNFVRVAGKDEIPPGKGKSIETGGVWIAVFNVGGEYRATSNVCVHRGGPLGEGDLEGPIVTCPWHGWQFDVTDGRCQTNPMASIPCYEVRIEGDDVLVGV